MKGMKDMKEPRGRDEQIFPMMEGKDRGEWMGFI
jgi:hypothetical protein